MFSAERVHRLAPGVLLDIVAELAYWKSCYPYQSFFHSRFPFDLYVPTFKFGYDTFLLHHKQVLDELLPQLQASYQDLHVRDRLEWKDAEAIIKAAWRRMAADSPDFR